MNPDLTLEIERCIAGATGESAEFVSFHATHGGCINQTGTVDLADHRRYFVKMNSGVPADFFAREAEGLMAIADSAAIGVPNVMGCGSWGSTEFLVLEAIHSDRRPADFSARFGQQLAALHQCKAGGKFGFPNSNYLGSTLQPNEWCSDWIQFWREHRLGFQFELARRNGYADREFNHLADRVAERLDQFLQLRERASLIHGDLWSGNFMVGAAGQPVLIDPAVYYGHREAEFGMITLFGGFDDSFHAAYNEAWPLESGSKERIEIYRLYHLLNHLNLFGSSYRAQCVHIMKKYA